jgi:hypothetical protein
LAALSASNYVDAGSSARREKRSLDLTGYTATFEERFKTLDISAYGPGTRWIAHTPWRGDFGDATFGDPSGPDSPFSLSPSGLRITARRDSKGHWIAGLIASMDRDGEGQRGFAQQYGYFEMRAKFPEGPGVWPAFWLIGTDKSSAASEIDVVEYYGAFPKYFHSWMHIFRDGRDDLLKTRLTEVEPGSLSDRFNDFGVSIEPDETRFFLNGQEIWAAATPAEYRQPMYVLANLAIGGGWPSDHLASPVVMEIEHILVFQRRDRLTAAPGSPRSLPAAVPG